MEEGFKPRIRPTGKQHLAWTLLQDKVSKFILFGGAAGGGKSWLGCEWLMVFCFMYPGTKWFIGREELKRLRESTLLTFFKVLNHHGIPQEYYKYNGQDNYILFTNGSRIDLLDLRANPSDPLFERYGSAEYTGGWIEEGGEVDFHAFDTLKSRIGRHLNDKYGLLGKILITANPKKNWLYAYFYKPWRAGTLAPGYAFVQSLVDDNPYMESAYRDNLLTIADQSKKQRLLFGNWEYDDDPTALIAYEYMVDMFTNTVEDDGRRYLICDVARYGRDKTVLAYWEGLTWKETFVYEKQGIDQTAFKIKEIANKKVIPYSHILVDEDGVGGGVVDSLRGVVGFVANATPFDNAKGERDNYQNLKAQCAYKLAEYINGHRIAVKTEDEQMKQLLVEELEQIKSKDSDKEKRLAIIGKDVIKEVLGRSPDYSDTMLMRMFFEIKPPVRSGPRQFIPQSRSYSPLARIFNRK